MTVPGADHLTEARVARSPGSTMRSVQTAWTEVYERLATAHPDGLGGGDLDALADAAFWLGRPRESSASRQKAYSYYRDAGDDARAAMAAWNLFHLHFDLDEKSVAGGWLGRAQRHAQLVPGQVEPGYVALAEADWAIYHSRLDEAVDHTQRAVDAGRQFIDRDLEAMGLAFQGRMLIAREDVTEGMRRLDDAMVATFSDALGPYAAGWVHCVLLSVCEQIGDVRRAAEWNDLAAQWCDEHAHSSWFPGVCRVHKCGVQSLRGEWDVAEREALRAAAELEPFAAYMVADGLYLAGEIRLRRGDYAGAEEAFRRTHELGRNPQPGLSMIRLAQGDAAGAATSLSSALTSGATGPLHRARLLAAHVEAELRRGNVDAARRSADELDDIATANRAPLLRAMAAEARAAIVMDSDAGAALRLLGEACTIYQELSCPYEVAQTRVRLGLAARALGDEETARLEFDAAQASFERLGAAPDNQRVQTLLRHDLPQPFGLTAREVEVLGLVARGQSNREIATDLFISEHTVARHLSNIFRKIDVSSRSAAGSFAYEHKLT